MANRNPVDGSPHPKKRKIWKNPSRYPCDECDYSVCTKLDLKNHMIRYHLGVGYFCSKCDFVSRSQSGLQGHITRLHILNVSTPDLKHFQVESGGKPNPRGKDKERMDGGGLKGGEEKRVSAVGLKGERRCSESGLEGMSSPKEKSRINVILQPPRIPGKIGID